MPTTYLLLRNNKQTGPLSLEELLQHSLKPHDLIWIEGRSAGWSNPVEIDALKPYVTKQQVQSPERFTSNTAQLQRDEDQTPRARINSTAHIYVSLPAGVQPRITEEPPGVNLEAKAEALYQKVQAFAEGKVAEDSETGYTRSLSDMKQEYSVWQMKQHAKKKNGNTKKKLAIAALVLIITTTSFGISKWISRKPVLKQQPLAGYALGTLPQTEIQQTTTASFHPVTDSFMINSGTASLQRDTVEKQSVAEKITLRPAGIVRKNTALKEKIFSAAIADTAIRTIMQPLQPEQKPAVQQEVKKIVPLSKLVTVSGTLQNDKKEKTATEITLQNNSSEILKTVAVAITYFRKEDRQLRTETVYFYNVQPASAVVIHASGNRKATSARFEITTITRADGSLYLIH